MDIQSGVETRSDDLTGLPGFDEKCTISIRFLAPNEQLAVSLYSAIEYAAFATTNDIHMGNDD